MNIKTYMGKESEKNEYICMYNWTILLYLWNSHNIVKQLYSSKK